MDPSVFTVIPLRINVSLSKINALGCITSLFHVRRNPHIDHEKSFLFECRWLRCARMFVYLRLRFVRRCFYCIDRTWRSWLCPRSRRVHRARGTCFSVHMGIIISLSAFLDLVTRVFTVATADRWSRRFPETSARLAVRRNGVPRSYVTVGAV